MNLILCGLPMSGKTTVGKLLAQHLKWDFIDTDRCLEKAYEQQSGEFLSCREIYKKLGEGPFRVLEQERLAALADNRSSVIALGGGCVKEPQNSEIVRSLGCLIYLKASPELLWKRVASRGIPAYLEPSHPEKAFYELSQKRIQDYEAAAIIIVDTDFLSEAEVLKGILEKTRI